MKVVLCKVYDDYCYGLRSLGAYLAALGHEVHYLILKSYFIRKIPFPALSAEAKRIADTTPGMLEVFTDGEVLLPDFKPITEREYRLFYDKLCELKPDVIGFSVTVAEMPYVAEVSKRIKQIMPGVPVVWGGTQPTADPASCVPHCDFAIRGEGELAFAKFLEDPGNPELPNLAYRKNGDVVQNPLLPLIQDLDQLPFPHYGYNEWLVEFDRLRRVTLKRDRDYLRERYIVMTSRGCPYNCSYCCHESFRRNYRGQNYVRRRSVRPVVQEIKRAQRRLGVDSCVVIDEILFKDEQWVLEFGRLLKHECDIEWGGYGHPIFTTESMLRQLRDTNLVLVALGVETGSKRISTQIYRRPYRKEALLRLARTCERLGINLTYDIITNSPWETEEDCMATVELLCELPRPYNVLVKRLKFFPGCSILNITEPKVNLPEKTFLFYNLLYHMTKDPSVPRETVLTLARDPNLKKHPEIMVEIAKATVGRFEEEQRQRERAHREARRWARKPGWQKVLIRLGQSANKDLPRTAFQALKSFTPMPIRQVAKRALAALHIL